MWRWIARQYSRRIVNVNVNIVVAGLLAMAMAMIPVYFSRHFGVDHDDTVAIGIIYAVADFIIDLILCIALHWMANHWPRKWRKTKQMVESAEHLVEQAGPPPLPFVKDTTLIQFQRMCLSPILYGTYGFVFLPIFKNALNWEREIAAFTAMFCGVIVTRVCHTFWMLHDERRWRRDWLKQIAARGLDSGGVPPTGPAPEAAGKP